MADIKINGATPSAFSYGSTAASAVYYGSTKLWEAAPQPQPQGVTIGDKFYPTVTIECVGTYPNFETTRMYEFMTVNLDYAWPGLHVSTRWDDIDYPYACYYNFDEATYGWSGAKNGLLYSEEAVQYLMDNSSTLLPTGWKLIPSGAWRNLCKIGGSSSSDTQGGVGLSSVDWVVPLSGYATPTNATGFNAIPCGFGKDYGSFENGYNEMTTSTSAELLTWLYDKPTTTRYIGRIKGTRATSVDTSFGSDGSLCCSIRLCRFINLSA